MAKAPRTGTLSAAEPAALADLVSYGTGSVVSRTLCKSQAGSLTLFAFDAGQGLSRHGAPFDAFVQVLDGWAELVIGEKVVRAYEGQIVRMPANVPHEIRPGGRFKMLLTMFKASSG